jgi:zinc transporter 1/2/3
MLRDQAPAPASTPGTGDHGSGDPVHFYHPGDPSSLPPPPGTGIPLPKPTGDIHHPANSSPPPPPHDGRPLSSIPPGPVPTGGQGSGKLIGVSGSGDRSTVPKQVANTPRDANDIPPPPGTVIPKPLPSGPAIPPPPPKDPKSPIPPSPIPINKAPNDIPPVPVNGTPKPVPSSPPADSASVPKPVSGTPKDVTLTP